MHAARFQARLGFRVFVSRQIVNTCTHRQVRVITMSSGSRLGPKISGQKLAQEFHPSLRKRILGKRIGLVSK